MTSQSPGALTGVRVLDLSRVVAGPLCASLLGDLGADVIKVEGPLNPDETRSWHPPEVSGIGVYFATVNRSKRAISVDLKTESGREIIRNLVRTSDVVIENFTTGTLERLGLDYPELRRINPRVILCSITGFGQTGPARAEPGYDFIAQAMTGFVAMNGAPGDEGTKAPIALADLQTGLHALISVLAALQARNQTGEGQHCDISLLDSMTFSLLNLATTFLNTGDVPPRYGNQHQTLVPYQNFATHDGEIVIAVGNDAQFARLCEVLERPELAVNDRFRTASARIRNREDLISLLQAELRVWHTAKLLEQLRQARVPSGPLNSIEDLFAEPQVAARDLVRTVEQPSAPPLKLIAAPFGLSGTPTRISLAPPMFSEHTDAVLEELGYDPGRRARLRAEGAIGPL
ncbi:CaiB/BaiF CoA transferase family protein [Leucobacter albus]|uniref:CaiB/BaiF CoA transferase family protein n=1 Tax=Leucobacter albus TaxID=272210 RepID=A0ABW3TMM6_9MICO